MRIVLALLFLCSLFTTAFAERLKPGDSLHITVWQDPKLDRTVVIGTDGQFGFPLAGHIRAGGRTPQAVESILRSRLAKKYTGELDISVTLASVDRDALEEVKPIFYVTGEVLKPGPFRLRPGTTIAQGIAQAGGFGVFAARQRIQIHRKFKGVDSIFLFDFNAFESGRIATDDINLRSGDVIIVPERGLFE
jgi:polysaccharide biosynthesis/export protein